MRTRVLLFISVALAMPFIVSAAAAITSANIAPSVPADAKQCILKLFQTQSQKKIASKQTTGSTVDGLNDTCTNESYTIDASGKKTITQTGRNGNNNLQTGCIADSCSGTECGKVALTVSVKGVPDGTRTISKCDPNYQKLLAGASGNPAQAMNGVALTALAQDAIVNANPNTVAGQDQLSKALQNFGVSSDDAQKVVTADAANNTNNAQALLNSFVSGDSTKISDAADKAGITLNADTISSITSLTPNQVSDNVSGLYSSDQKVAASNIENSPSTFSQSTTDTGAAPQSTKGGQYAPMFNQLEQKYNLPSGYLASVAKVESGGNPNICASGSSACGMFQYTSGTWTVDSQRYNLAVNGVNAPLDQSLRFDAATEASVTAYTASYNQSTYASSIQNAVNAGMDPSAALYSIHNLGSGGGPAFMNAYAQDSSQPVSNVVSQAAIKGNPGLYGDGSISLAQAQQNMLNAMGGNTNFAASSNPANVTSPFTATTGTAAQSYYVTNGQSPYANMSNVYSAPGTGYGSTNGYGSSYGSGYGSYGNNGSGYGSYGTPVQSSVTTQNTYQAYTPPATQTTTQTTPTTTKSAAGQTGTPVAQIIVQPANVSKGHSVTVSWSSAGMSAASVCQVRENSATILANSNEGSQVVAASSTGTLSFSLSCAAQGTAQTVQSSASATVQ